MKNTLTPINPEKESKRIVHFIQSTLKKTGFKKLVIGVSGGIDSTTSLYLVRKILSPHNIFLAHLYYFKPQNSLIRQICSNLQIPIKNQYFLSIKKPVDELTKLLKIQTIDNRRLKIDIEDRRSRIEKNQSSNFHPQDLSSTINLLSSKIRLGNIMARIRMIILFDLAKKHQALICGTENKSEHLLGYFTRFGDEASDLEPIQHLYKTQVFQLGKYLKIPEKIIKAKPSAGLWSDQTDEGEFGFSYSEADPVLYLYFEKNQSVEEITQQGYKNVKKIIDFARQNSFKHKTPYSL